MGVEVEHYSFNQCFKNRIGSVSPIGRIVDRPQNRSGSIKKPFLHLTSFEPLEPTVGPVIRMNRPVLSEPAGSLP